MKKVVFSGMIGNGLEWYDYALYGQMALLISQLFFPAGDATAHLLATYGIFAAGFVVRPLGAVLFGWIGDTYGRKTALILSVVMMAAPTGCIGLLPTYAQIGVWAPVLLTVLRLLQGLSLGGGFSGSITYIVEHAPVSRRGFAGSASLVSLIIGFLAGSVVTTATLGHLGEAEFNSWGWRLPFLFGIVVGLLSYYFLRTQCHESPAYLCAREDGTLSQTPVREACRHHWREMLQGFGMYISVTMPFYLTTVYFISFTHKQLGIAMDDALKFNLYNMLALLVTMPFSAWLSDRVGRKRLMTTYAIVMMMVVYPLFSSFSGGSLAMVGLAQVGFAALLGMYIGPVAAVLVELFPTSVRYTGMAIAYNVAAALFGGTAPMVCEWLIKATGNNSSIALYVIACNLVSLLALFFYKDHYREPLR